MGMPMEHPKLRSLRNLLDLSKIFAIIFVIINLLWAVVSIVATLGFGIFFAWIPIVAAVLNYLIYDHIKRAESLVAAGRYFEAKESLLIWMILGFFTGFALLGILLLIAYLDLDSLIDVQRQGQMGSAPPGWAPPTATPAWPNPTAATPIPSPIPAPAPLAPAAPSCPQCHQPATWIAQYGRWYCYNDKQYL
jgi:hypothetical protein